MCDIANKWLSFFASTVSSERLENHVKEAGNFLWHIFTWGRVECLSGEKARTEFDKIKYSNAVYFESGYAIDDGIFLIENLKETKKILANSLNAGKDTYITDIQFRWTYVQTHETDCGPFFCTIVKQIDPILSIQMRRGMPTLLE